MRTATIEPNDAADAARILWAIADRIDPPVGTDADDADLPDALPPIPHPTTGVYADDVGFTAAGIGVDVADGANARGGRGDAGRIRSLGYSVQHADAPVAIDVVVWARGDIDRNGAPRVDVDVRVVG